MARERSSLWLIGAVIGVFAGVAIITFGTPALFLSVAVLALAFAGVRSLALLSGAFIAFGATWAALAIRATIACQEFDRLPNAECQGPDLVPFLSVAAGVGIAGLLLGWGAVTRRRKRRHDIGAGP